MMRFQAFIGILLVFLSGAHSATFTFTNKCPYIVWPGTLTGGGGSQLSSTGFELASGASTSLNVQAPWSGRFWGRTQCSTDSSGKFSCTTGDCGSGKTACNGAGAIPPALLVELTLATNGGQDFYDVSLVDGFNLPIMLAPQGGYGDCNSTSCASNVNTVCPPKLSVKGSDGSVIGCKSACMALNQPQYCCTGAYGSPDTCPPTNYSKIFKNQCPQAYSYAYDDKSSTFTCFGGPNYAITFCP
ncbi:thaumatin-like protein 1 isoform X2 [Prunus persica]|nr:thaumatin-like protein 1 isoform X2 [Prunus persica]XP_020416933.1 thaumatin-like protein 1 isoform X2 [Prunus persica]XP_020416934.1 thaumatin-like protein 1 isoform X2 [Prunus persica]